jgi:hypothetical protein
MVNDRLLETKVFPARTSKFYMSVAGVCCAVISQDTSFLNFFWERYWRFESKGPAEYEIIAQFLTPEAFSQEEAGSASSSPVKRMNTGSNFMIKPAAQPFIAFANTASKKVLVKMVNSHECFDSFLQTLFTLILAEKGALTLFSTPVTDNGQTNIFFRSSVDSRTDPLEIYRDNFSVPGQPVIIKPHNNHFRVYGTPFRDEQLDRRTNGKSQLRAVYVLKKDDSSDLITLEKTRAVLELYRSAASFTDDGQLSGHLLRTCCKIADAVPVYELRFQQDPFESSLLRDSSRGDMAFHVFMPVK